jgi:dTMP kinase
MKKNNYPGKFIVFEGLDGSGQTTQANLLKKFLEKKGFKVLLTKEPTNNNEFGKRIDKILHRKEKVSPLNLQKFFIKDRDWHLKNIIEPALKEGKIVISDRYFFSTFAFGGIDVDMEKLIKMNDNFLMHDISIFLDVKPKTCISRIEGRSQKTGERKTIFEKEKLLEKVYKNYLVLLKKFPLVRINGQRSIEDVHKEIKEIVIKKIK